MKKGSELEDVAAVVNPITGESLTPKQYAKRQGETAREKTEGRFIRGPLPLLWWREAGKLSKSANRVGLALFYLRGLSKSNRFKLTPARLRELGIGRDARRRGLEDLERAGLVRVLESGRGKVAVVEILLEAQSPALASNE